MIIGNARAIRYLTAILKTGKIPHGLLFHGPRSVGKRTAAAAFARGLFCVKRPRAFGGCGLCEGCVQVRDEGSPDYIVLRPGAPILAASEIGKREIGIEEAREVRRRLGFAHSGWRVVLIDGAEFLTEPAANALLKILEEPQEKILFIIIAENLRRVLPTMRSRAVLVQFLPVPESELAKIPGADGESTRLALGAPGRLLEIIGGAERKSHYQKMMRDATEALCGKFSRAFEISDQAAKNPEARSEMLRYLLALLAERIPAARGARGFSAAKAFLAAFQALETANVNPRLATDILFMKAREI